MGLRDIFTHDDGGIDNDSVRDQAGGDDGTDTDDSSKPTVDFDRDPRFESLLGEQYQFRAVDSERMGGVETKTFTEEDLVVGPQLRRLLEQGSANPRQSLWLGYLNSSQEGFREIGLEFDSLFQHLLIVGATGTGKSTLFDTMGVQLAYRGFGYIYDDPKGDNAIEMLRTIPEHRLDDVVWIEPGVDRGGRSVRINFLDMPSEDDVDEMELNRMMEDRVQIIKALFNNSDYWGPTMRANIETISRAMLRANTKLPDEDQYCLMDIYFMLLKKDRREQFAAESDDPFLRDFLDEIAEMDRDEVRPIITRMLPWTQNGLIRRIIACRKSSVDFREWIENDRIVILRIPVANNDVNQMITLGTVRPVWTAIQNRAAEKKRKDRQPYFAFIDEAEAVLNDSLEIDDMLARARSMNFGLGIGCQYPTQLEEKGVLDDVKNNCNTTLAFKLNATDDARIVMNTFRDYDHNDLTETADYRIWTRLPVKGGSQLTPAMKLHSFAPYPPLRSEEEVEEEVIPRALENFGAEPLTDAEIIEGMKFGHLSEALGVDDADEALEGGVLTPWQQSRVCKAVFDEAIRQGADDGFVFANSVRDRLDRYLHDVDVSTPAKMSAALDYLSRREIEREDRDGKLYLKCTEHGEQAVYSAGASLEPTDEKKTQENQGGEGHKQLLRDTYRPLMDLGLLVDIPQQDGSDMPDAVATLEDVPEFQFSSDATPREIATAVDDFEQERPILAQLTDAADVAIEAEKSTGDTRPGQTVRNLVNTVDDGGRCLFVCRESTALKIHGTLHDADRPLVRNHDVDGETWYYNDPHYLKIDGNQMYRSGDAERTLWFRDETTGEVVMRDSDGVEHARFPTAEAVYTNASKYADPDDPDVEDVRRVKPPVIPGHLLENLSPAEATERCDIIAVPSGATDADDLSLVDGGRLVPLSSAFDGDETNSPPAGENGATGEPAADDGDDSDHPVDIAAELEDI